MLAITLGASGAGAQSVTPDGGSLSAAANAGGLSASFTVENMGETTATYAFSCYTTGAVASCTAPGDITLAGGTTAIVSVPYSTGSSGSGTLVLELYEGLFLVDDGSYNVTVGSTSPTYTVSVTPDGQSVSVAANASQTQPFTVTSTGNTGATYDLSASCSGTASGCATSASAVSLAAGASATITVSYGTGGYGTSGRVLLRAAYSGNTSIADTGWVTVSTPAASYTVAVTPDGTGERVPPGTGSTRSFVVWNSGNSTATYSLAAGCSSAISGCAPAHSSVTLAPSQQASIGVSFEAAGSGSTAGSGHVALHASYGSATDSGYYALTVSCGIVVPCGTNAAPAIAASRTASFGVNALLTDTGTYDVTCSYTAPVTSCVADSAVVTITQSSIDGYGTDVAVTYTSTNTSATGTVRLTLTPRRAGLMASEGYYTVLPASQAFAIAVTPDTLVPQPPAGTMTAQGYHLRRTSDATGGVHYAISLACTTPVTNCQLSRDTATLHDLESIPVHVTYTPGTAGTTGSMTVTAVATEVSGISDAGRTTPTASAEAITSCTLNGIASPCSPAGADTAWSESTDAAAFTIASNADRYDYSCSYTTPITGCTTSRSGSTVTVSYTVGKPTTSSGWSTASLVLLATPLPGTGVTTSRGRYVVTIRSRHLVEVGPDAGRIYGLQNLSNTYAFQVRNAGVATATYRLQARCSGAVNNCVPADTLLSLAPSATATNVLVSYTGGALGDSGTLSLVATATADGASDSGWVRITLDGRPLADVRSVNPGAVVERDLCLTIAVGDAAAAECGDLRLVHGTPAVRTMNKSRAPTLHYNSQHAYPYPVVGAYLTLRSGLALPDSITTALLVNGSSVAYARWNAGEWSTARTRRVTLGFDGLTYTTGVYPYQLEVASYYGATRMVQTVSDTLIVVNRSTSAFGAGWWLAGLEQLQPSTKTWIGGDGSVRVYRAVAPNIWAGPALDRPDTLKWDGTHYVRYLPDGLRVLFDSSGQHVKTINRLGHETVFAYSGGRLSRISVPPASAGLVFDFMYNGTTAVLDSISAPGVGSKRVTRFTMSSGRITAIRDPDGHNVAFSYPSSTSGLIDSRTDKRGNRTAFGYDDGRRFRFSSLDPGTPMPDPGRFPDSGESEGSHIAWGFVAQETRGLATPGSVVSIDTSHAYARLDGPRSQVPDTTVYRLNRFGAPFAITNALGHTIALSYDDARWPGRPTRIRHPNGRVIEAVLDSRGLDSLVIDSIGAVATRPDTTRYEYDARWFSVTRIVPPERDSVVFQYDTASGNRLWQQDARGATSRSTYTYHTSGVAVGLMATVTPPGAGSDSLRYDALGNLDQLKNPLGHVAIYTNDEIGRLSTTSSPIDETHRVHTRRLYDVMDRITREETDGPAVSFADRFESLKTYSRDAMQLTVETFYDPEGNADSVVRYSVPDSNGIGRSNTSWRYDGANRKIAEVAPDALVDSFFYDPAGNRTSWRTRRGDVIRVEYDVLNRISRRIVPSVWYPEDTIRGWYFPRYTTGLTIEADTATFRYDAVGNMVRADNRDAQVRRSYTLQGFVETDTLRIRVYSGTDMSSHVYGLQHRYDRNGRLVWTRHPSNLKPAIGKDTVSYRYGSFGQLQSVRDVLGNEFRFLYDAQTRIDSVAYPGGVWEKRYYDALGRMWRRQALSPVVGTDSGFVGGVIHDDTLQYDHRGKIIVARGARGELHDLYYDGLGATMTARDGQFPSDPSGAPSFSHTDAYWSDALGNRTYTSRLATESSTDRSVYAPLTGRRVRNRLVSGTTGIAEDTTVYDPAGNQIEVIRRDWYRDCSRDSRPCGGSQGGDIAPNGQVIRSYYGADNKLRVVDKRSDIAETWNIPEYAGAFDEYRYDALGRRVLTRSRGDCDACSFYIERIVYDGDQLLYEIHMPGGDEEGLNLERDTEALWDIRYGRVIYTHGGGLDQPLSVIRVQYGTWEPTAVVPHQNWRGLFDVGTFDNGAATRCRKNSDGTNSGDCVRVHWQAQNMNVQFELKKQSTIDAPPHGYWGSLISNKQDATGQHYMRNRFYDPVSGRFTQEDPIGLAGGLNVYGFAKGDPVTFSDPYGLCPPIEDCLRQGGDVAAGMTPGLSTVLDAATVVTGKNLVTGEQVGMGGRALAFAGLVTPASGGELRGIGKIVAGLTERFGEPVTRALKNGASQLEWTNSKNGVKFIVRGPETHPIKQGGPPVRHTNVEVHKPLGDGRFKKQGNAHLDDNGNVIP